MSEEAAARLDALRRARHDALTAGPTIEPLVAGPEHALLAAVVAGELRALVEAATGVAELVTSWQYLAGMCGLFDDLGDAERPPADWRARIEQALALIEEATA